MRNPITLAALLIWLCAIFADAKAEFPTRIEKSVGPGQTVGLISLRQYQSERGCTPTPTGQFDGDPKPKFGTLVSSSKTVLTDGPCGKAEYPIQTIGYKAGSTSGVDEFELYIYPTAFWGGSPWRIKVRIAVGGARTSNPVGGNVSTTPQKAGVIAPKDQQNPITQSRKDDRTTNSISSDNKTKPSSSELKPVNRRISVLRGQSVIAGYTYHLNNDCSLGGAIASGIIQEPKSGMVQIKQEPGFSNYAKDDIKFECNRQKSEVTRIYYKAPEQAGKDHFTVQFFYANGNTRKYEIAVDIN